MQRGVFGRAEVIRAKFEKSLTSALLLFCSSALIIILTACSSAPLYEPSAVLNSSMYQEAYASDSNLFGYNETQQPLRLPDGSQVNTGGVFQQWRDVLNRHMSAEARAGISVGAHVGRSDEFLLEERCKSSRTIEQQNDCQLSDESDSRFGESPQETLEAEYEWKEFLNSLKERTAMEQIKEVNAYVNQKAYKTDIDNYGINDYWAMPREFLLRGGDCEDYAIAKLLFLQQLGFNVESMRLVVVMDTNLRIPHAVLAVYVREGFKNSMSQGFQEQENSHSSLVNSQSPRDILILDNQTKDVVSHRKLSHYVPIYSINEKGWWIHASK